MLRDVVMIISVMVSVVSVGFGFYKNIEAENNRAFIYEQAYEIIGSIQEANIAPQTKAQLTDDALRGLGAPPPVIDLSRSRADVGDGERVCTPAQEQRCTRLADDLGRENGVCVRSREPTGPLCAQAARTKALIVSEQCFVCF